MNKHVENNETAGNSEELEEFLGEDAIPLEDFPDPVFDADDAMVALGEGFDPAEGNAYRLAATSTQEENPSSTAWRTALQAGLPSFLILGLAIPEILRVILDEFGETLPEGVRAWLLGAAALVTMLSAAAARIMAIPGVNKFFRRSVPVLAPEDTAEIG